MTAKKPESWRVALPKRLNELQRTVEKQVQKGLDQATELLPPAPRKAMKRMTANVERMRSDLRKSAEKALADARKRAETVAATVSERIEGVVTPLTRRFDVASRTEVNQLHKRVRELERRIGQRSQRAA